MLLSKYRVSSLELLYSFLKAMLYADVQQFNQCAAQFKNWGGYLLVGAAVPLPQERPEVLHEAVCKFIFESLPVFHGYFPDI